MLLKLLTIACILNGCHCVQPGLLARYLGLYPRQLGAPPGLQLTAQQQLQQGIPNNFYPGPAGIAGYMGDQALIPGYPDGIPGGMYAGDGFMPGMHGGIGGIGGMGQMDPYNSIYAQMAGMGQYGVNPYTHYNPYIAPETMNQPPPLCRPNMNQYIVDTLSGKEYKFIGFPDNDPGRKIDLFTLCGRGETLLILRNSRELQSLIPILDCVVNHNSVAVLTGGFVDNTGTYTVCPPGPNCRSRIKRMPFVNFAGPVGNDPTLKYVYITTRSGNRMEAIPHDANSVFVLQQQGLPVGYICEKIRHPDVFDFGNNNPSSIFW